jgi:hypothetical protein
VIIARWWYTNQLGMRKWRNGGKGNIIKRKKCKIIITGDSNGRQCVSEAKNDTDNATEVQGVKSLELV